MNRRLGILAITLSLLGCSAQASVGATGKSNPGGVETAGAEPLKPRESNWDKESREEAMIAAQSAPAQESEAVAAADAPAATDDAMPAPTNKARRHKKKK